MLTVFVLPIASRPWSNLAPRRMSILLAAGNLVVAPMLEVQIGLVVAAWLVADLNEMIFGPSEVVTIAGRAEVVDSGRVEGFVVGRAGLVASELVCVVAAAAAVVAIEVDGFGVAAAE